MVRFLYNRGAITRPPFDAGAYGRVHNFVWGLRQVLSADAVLLVAWADAQIERAGPGGGWVPRVDHIQRTFGWDDKQWRRVRDELKRVGCLTADRERAATGHSVHTLSLDLTFLLGLVPAPPAISGGSRACARPAANGGIARPAINGESRDPAKVAGVTTKSSPTQDTHHQVEVGGEGECQQGRPGGPVAPAGAGDLLGDLLADLLADRAARVRVNTAAAGAATGQLEAAAAAVRATVTAGKVRSVTGLAVQMGRLAACGEVQQPQPGGPAPRAPAALDPWPARELAAAQGGEGGGVFVDHSRGRLWLQPGARAWRDSDGGMVAGRQALQVWEKVDSGALKLQGATNE